ncbi:DUF1259 domain-containing protein [Noviherbaspirillum sp. UKPF54]|uniref:DUF1259 domain-containing protein n=1 Tax=Noviherbaspirillum sp. UKPF54 TaxID=2601898 RepID=UPI0011B17313|nr:DUF1259 domain-containing protein [Noviherbaspirillum sp. UKPF54]QDZ29609.1 DUF1259 domain-containing protein [Noviherbaspirillum sp. UKPF54]
MLNRFAVSVAISAALAAPVWAQGPAFDTARIEQAIGMKGSYNAKENVFKVTKPRPNMAAVTGWKIPPFLGASSYAAFTPAGNGEALVMGDNVLYEDEVGPAMDAALQNGLEVTALHNHFFFEEPRIYFMHIDGMGDPAKLGAGVKKVLEAADRVRSQHAAPANQYPAEPVPAQNRITGAPLEAVFGKKGESSNGMFKVSFGHPVKMHGVTAGDAMGANTWAGFAGTDSQAVVDGDFAVSEDELQPVLKSLRGAGINIAAIHQHMTHEEPRLMFLHYWGQGKAQDLAKAVMAAVNLTAAKAQS